MSVAKRFRGLNFTTEEELMLVEEISKEKLIIECKTTNKNSNKEKDEAWQRVLSAFNSKSIRLRTIEQIKSKFDNLKSKARAIVSAEKTHIKGTGGGRYMGTHSNPVIEAVLQILNFKTVVGLQPTFDSDVAIFDIIPIDLQTWESNQKRKIVLEEVPYQSVSLSTDDPVGSCCQTGEVLPKAQLPSPFELVETGNTQPDFEVIVAAGPSNPDATNNDNKSNSQPSFVLHTIVEENWGSYVPRKLRGETSNKLRPTAANPIFMAKERYYKRKVELLEASEARQVLEQERKEKKEELHRKKMQIFELDTALREKQLKN